MSNHPGSSSHSSSSSSSSSVPTDTTQLISQWEATYISFLRLQDIPELQALIQDLTTLQEAFLSLQGHAGTTSPRGRQLPYDELRNIWQTIVDCERMLDSFKTPKGPKWDALEDADTQYAISYVRRRAIGHVNTITDLARIPNPFDMQDMQATMRRPSISTSNPYPPSNTFSHPYRSHFQATSPSTAPSTAPQSTFSPARRSGKSTNATMMSPRITVPDGFQLPDPALSPSTFTPHGLGELYQFVYEGNGGGQGSSGSGSSSNQQGGAGQQNQ